MFQLISSFILRNRRMLLAVIAGLTLIFGFLATRIELSYDFARVLPANDPFALEYEMFKATFG